MRFTASSTVAWEAALATAGSTCPGSITRTYRGRPMVDRARQFRGDSAGWCLHDYSSRDLHFSFPTGLARLGICVGLMEQHPGCTEPIPKHREPIGERSLLHLHKNFASVAEQRIHA